LLEGFDLVKKEVMIEQRKKKIRRRKKGDAELKTPRQATKKEGLTSVGAWTKGVQKEKATTMSLFLYCPAMRRRVWTKKQKNECHQKDNVYPQAKLINLRDKKK
jgi:hypothetical protein